MDLRLIEVILPTERIKQFQELLSDERTLGIWDEVLTESQRSARILVKASEVETIVDQVETAFSHVDDFRVLVLRVEATVPQPEEDEEDPEDGTPVPQRVSRQELFAEISRSAELTPVYLSLVVLSTIVAAIGLLRDSGPVIIGAMVIAPLLGPNVALALSTTLSHSKLGWTSLKTNLTGISLAFVLSCMIGLVFGADPSTGEIATRTQPHPSDIVLALASGCAGVLAYTTGAPTSLIGVMVAVALLPPLTVVGLMLATGNFDEAMGAALLLLVNVICVNLAGILTFLAQGIRPRLWWKADRAKRASRIAICVWGILLAILIALLTLIPGLRAAS